MLAYHFITHRHEVAMTDLVIDTMQLAHSIIYADSNAISLKKDIFPNLHNTANDTVASRKCLLAGLAEANICPPRHLNKFLDPLLAALRATNGRRLDGTTHAFCAVSFVAFRNTVMPS